MRQEEAFLEAIRQQPDDDAPRLIYADWLEEHGQPERAEFIRVQIEMDRLPEGSPRWYDLDGRAQALLAQQELDWLGPMAEVLTSWLFRRGFLDSVELQAEMFLRRGEELFRREPIRKYCLRDPFKVVDTLPDSPLLAKIRSLSLVHIFGDGFRSLCSSPHFVNLTELNLFQNHLNTEAIAVLQQAPFFAQLQALDLSNNFEVGATAVEHLVAGPKAAALRRLNLGFNQLGAAGVQALTAARQFFQGLNHLHVAGNEVSAAGARSLAHAGGNLTELSIGWNPLRDEGVQALVQSSAASGLTSLDISRCGLGRAGAAALAQSPHLQGLTQLVLSGNSIRTEGIKALASSSVLSHLKVLDLTGNEIGDEGVKILAQSPHVSNLQALYLGANGLRIWSLRDLVMSPNLRNLYTLDLHGNNLGDRGAQIIANWLELPQLTNLCLRNTHISDAGVKELAASTQLSRLRELDLSNNDITDVGRAVLESSGLPASLTSSYLEAPEEVE
jgi:uncharacterized protein (TIGR02996 family)